MIEEITRAWRAAQNRGDAYDELVSQALAINRTDLRCIDIIDQEGRPSAGRLAELMGLTTGATTALLDRLEGAGYIRRVRDDVDRRRIYVELTELVMERIYPFYEPLARIGDELYRGCTLGQLEFVLRFLEKGNALSARELTRLRAQLAGDGSS